MSPTTTRESTTHTDDLQIFLDIVQLVNVHRDEDELIEAVLQRLDQIKASAGIVFRRLDAKSGRLIPCLVRSEVASEDGLLANASPELVELLSTEIPTEGTFEGHALATKKTCTASPEGVPDIEITADYEQLIHKVLELGCHEAHFFAVHAVAPIGTLVMYSIDGVSVDPRRSQLLERAAQVLAFGIEKCRALSLVDRRREELHAANERLTESNRDLEDFAYVASHDLQEPLRKIQAFGDRLESKASERLTADSLANLQRMQGASRQMQVLINDLLRYSRVSSSALKLQRISLSSLLDEVIAAHEREFSSVGATVEVDQSLPVLMVDTGQFDQVFTTLIGNAIKYRRPVKPLVVTVTCDDSEPDVHRITVADNGIGFDQKYADRVFEPFKRLHSAADYAGSGIGLAICRRVLDRHDGTISVQSESGVGSAFTLTLPRSNSTTGQTTTTRAPIETQEEQEEQEEEVSENVE